MGKYKLSIIIPAYNAENYLPQLLACLDKQMIPGVEVIIIDDGQIMIEENTEELLARAYRVSGEETNVDAAVRNFSKSLYSFGGNSSLLYLRLIFIIILL